MEDAVQFLEKIGTDKVLLTKAQDIGKENIESFAEDLGYSITLGELHDACKHLLSVEEGEIEESDLDGVSGGVGLLTAVTAGAALYAVGKAEGWW